MIDPKKLLAFVQRENGVQPMAPPPMEGDELLDEDMELEPEEGEDVDDEGGDEGEAAEGLMSVEEVEEIVEMIEAGEGDPMLVQLCGQLAAEVEEFGDDADIPPVWVADPALWDEATATVESSVADMPMDMTFCVIAHVYQRAGGAVA